MPIIVGNASTSIAAPAAVATLPVSIVDFQSVHFASTFSARVDRFAGYVSGTAIALRSDKLLAEVIHANSNNLRVHDSVSPICGPNKTREVGPEKRQVIDAAFDLGIDLQAWNIEVIEK